MIACLEGVRRGMRRGWTTAVLFLLAAAGPGAANAQSSHAAQGRVSALEGNLLVNGPDTSDWSYVERNAVVFDGDAVWADENSLAELEMERGAWLRLGPETRVLLRRLPPDGDV